MFIENNLVITQYTFFKDSRKIVLTTSDVKFPDMDILYQIHKCRNKKEVSKIDSFQSESVKNALTISTWDDMEITVFNSKEDAVNKRFYKKLWANDNKYYVTIHVRHFKNPVNELRIDYKQNKINNFAYSTHDEITDEQLQMLANCKSRKEIEGLGLLANWLLGGYYEYNIKTWDSVEISVISYNPEKTVKTFRNEK